MAGTVTVTEEVGGGVSKVSFAFTSDATGAADGATTRVYTGAIMRVVFAPNTSTTQPTDLFDVVINDDDGADALMGNGANLSNVANTQKGQNDGLGVVKNTALTLGVTNAGNAKTGAVHVYILET